MMPLSVIMLSVHAVFILSLSNVKKNTFFVKCFHSCSSLFVSLSAPAGRLCHEPRPRRLL